MNPSELIKELNILLIQSNGIIPNYEFYCSKDYECDLLEHKGIKISYINVMPKNTIYYSNYILFSNYIL